MIIDGDFKCFLGEKLVIKYFGKTFFQCNENKFKLVIITKIPDSDGPDHVLEVLRGNVEIFDNLETIRNFTINFSVVFDVFYLHTTFAMSLF